MGTSTTTKAAPPALAKVRAALADLGSGTAAAIAEHAGLGYSTTTPKLRQLRDNGEAETFDQGTQTLWRLTPGQDTDPTTIPDDAGSTTASGPDVTATSDEHTASRTDQPAPQTHDTPTVADTRAAEDSSGTPPTVDGGDTDLHHAQATGEGEHPTAGSSPDEAALGADEPQSTAAAPASDGSPDAEQPTHSTIDDQPDDAEPNPSPRSDEADSDATGPSTPSAEPPAEAATTPEGKTRRRPTKPRRTKGSLREAVLRVLQDNPDTAYKVGQVCKLVDAASKDQDVNPAGAGAVANALIKLTNDGLVTQTLTSPATYQATAQ